MLPVSDAPLEELVKKELVVIVAGAPAVFWIEEEEACLLPVLCFSCYVLDFW